MADELVVVYETSNPVEAVSLRTVLEEAGLAVVEHTPEALPFVQFSRPRYTPVHRLLVRTEDAPQAAALIGDYTRQVAEGEYALPEEYDAPGTPPPLPSFMPRMALAGRVLLVLVVLATLAVLIWLATSSR